MILSLLRTPLQSKPVLFQRPATRINHIPPSPFARAQAEYFSTIDRLWRRTVFGGEEFTAECGHANKRKLSKEIGKGPAN